MIFENASRSTRDGSASRVFFTLSDQLAAPPASGARIGLTIVLDNAAPDDPLEMRCDGRVMRVDETAGAMTTTGQFEPYRFDRSAAGATP